MHPTEPRKSIRELIAELAQLEEARRSPSVLEPDAHEGAGLGRDLLDLARREREVIAELRRHSTTS